MSLTYAQRVAAEKGWTRETAAEKAERMKQPLAQWLVAEAEHGTMLEEQTEAEAA